MGELFYKRRMLFQRPDSRAGGKAKGTDRFQDHQTVGHLCQDNDRGNALDVTNLDALQKGCARRS